MGETNFKLQDIISTFHWSLLDKGVGAGWVGGFKSRTLDDIFLFVGLFLDKDAAKTDKLE